MRLYKVIVALFAFTMFAIMLNDVGIFDYNVPHQNLTVNTAEITSLTESPSAENAGLFEGLTTGGVGFVLTSWKVLNDVTFSVLNVDNFMRDMGIPGPMRTMFYSMLVLIAVFGLMKYISGRSDKGID